MGLLRPPRLMPNSYAKGNRFETEVKKTLEKEGWTVEGQHRKVSWIPDYKKLHPITRKPLLRMIMQGRDIYGCDLLAKKENEKTHFIQISTRENKSHKIKQVSDYPWNYDHDVVQLWLRTEGKREYEIFQAPDFESVGIKKIHLT